MVVALSCCALIFAPFALAAQGDTSLIKSDSIRYWVQQLSHDSMEGRLAGSAGGAKAASWIAGKFQQLGLQPLPGNNGFFYEFKAKTFFGPRDLANVIGVIPSANPRAKKVFITAHYDHVGTGTNFTDAYPALAVPQTGNRSDTIYNGALDNASGVASLLSLAAFFKSAPPPDVHLVFIAFTAEELGMLGSEAMVRKLHKDSVLQVINLEMLGRGRGKRKQDNQPYITSSDHDEWVIGRMNNYYSKLNPAWRGDYFLYDPFVSEQLYSRSDNYLFSLYDIPANTIMLASPKDQYYHQAGDEWQTLDYDLMEATVRAIAITLHALFATPVN